MTDAEALLYAELHSLHIMAGPRPWPEGHKGPKPLSWVVARANRDGHRAVGESLAAAIDKLLELERPPAER